MVGQTLGRYRLLERLGAGGMGVVYRAHDERLDREVAVKILPDTTVADARARRRFRQEAEAISRLNHPNIATIHDFDEVDGTDLLVMELIPGETLHDRLDRGPLTAAEFRALAPQLVEGLAAAHAAGVLHRDLKPANVRVTPDGRLKILDFGLALLLAADEQTKTDPGGDLRGAGTPPYVAPEQLAGDDVDERADTYSAGATLYEMALGRRLFPDARGSSLLHAVLSREPEPPRNVDPRIDPALETLLLKAIDKDKARRYQSARDLLVDVRRLDDARPAPPSRRAGRKFRTWAASVAVAGCLFWVANALERPVSAFPERGWALIGNLENQTDDPSLETTVRNALTMALQQSQYVNVLTRERVADALTRMQLQPDAVVDEAVGLEICRREGVRVLIAGSVLQSGRTTRIDIRAIDATTGDWLFAMPVQYDRPEDLFDRADALAAHVRRRLGESFATVRQSRPLAQVTTSSTAALRQYSLATDARARGDLDQVEPALDAALALDDRFVMAHLKLGDYYAGVVGDRTRALEHLDRAFADRDRVSERERLFIEAAYFTAREQYAQARASLAALARLYPEDPEIRYELGLAHYSLNELPAAVAEIRAAVQRHPHGARAQGSLVLFLARNNQPSEAVEAWRAAAAAGVDSEYLLWGLGLAQWGRGDLEAAADAFERLAAGSGFYQALGRLHRARLALYQGRVGDALAGIEDVVRRAEAAGITGMERLGRSLIARVRLARDENALARRQVDLLLAAGAETLATSDLRWAGAVLAGAGDAAAARALLERIEARLGDGAPSYTDFAFHELTGRIALAGNRVDEAVDAFDRASRTLPFDVAWQGLATSLERRGDRDGAIRAWLRFLEDRGHLLQDGFPLDWGLALLSLARDLEAAGRKDEACARYAAVTDLWRDATVTAWHDEARGRLTALGCAPRTDLTEP